MSEQDEIQQFLLCAGFPRAGKTTFLAALWHTVNSGDVPSALELKTLYEGDREYLNARTQEWLEFREVKRTLQDHPEPILMTLRSRSDGAVLRINVPDISGETFRMHFEDRWCTKAFDDRARSVSGLLFFVHPGTAKDPTKISAAAAAVEAWPIPDANAPQDMDSAASRELELKELPSFTIQECCTQAKCVDLLQLLLERIQTCPLRVAIVVSAFDELDQTPFENQPREFLRKRFALLWQYLRASDRMEWTVYGLSAQGGRYDKSGVVEMLASQGIHRIRVCGNSGVDNDITRPLRWLAFGAE